MNIKIEEFFLNATPEEKRQYKKELIHIYSVYAFTLNKGLNSIFIKTPYLNKGLLKEFKDLIISTTSYNFFDERVLNAKSLKELNNIRLEIECYVYKGENTI